MIAPMSVKVALRKDLARSLRQGHPWVFREALADPPALPNGSMVTVTSRDGRPLAYGYWTATGPIAVRVLDLRPVPDAFALIESRLRQALALRLQHLDLATTNAFRWAHGEADHLPGIHIDIYDQVAAVRLDGPGARAFYRDLGSLLPACAAPLHLAHVVDREARGPAVGEIEVRENGIRFIVDPDHGQKGGLFLDQRENRKTVAARAAGKSVLNLYGYTGAFSLYAAKAGARSTDTVDIAKPALAAARRNFQINGLSLDRAGFHAMDALAFLEQAATKKRTWDIVISDPPSFAPKKSAVPAARRAYLRLHRLAASVVAPGGLLAAASCSSHFPRKEFLASVQQGVAQADRHFRRQMEAGAGFDHPTLPIFPEGDYLKFVLGLVE
jgi:23S rRNA (cytosine1962-C5)-methyltransferase